MRDVMTAPVQPAASGVPGPAPAVEEAPAEARLLTVAQAGKYLSMTPAALYHAVARREIPYVRTGKRALRFDVEALGRWIGKRTVKPLAGPKHESLEPAAVECHDASDGSRQVPPERGE